MIENFEHVPEHPTSNRSQICRVCLTTNVKMFSLQKYEFHKKYQEITGLQISPDDKYPGFLCWECAQHLSNCHQFKTRAVLSHYLLSGLLETDLNITEQNVSKINRDKNGLVSKLKSWKSQPNYFNLELTEPQTNDRIFNVTLTNHQVQITIVENKDDDFLPEDNIKKEIVNVKEESSGDDFDDDKSVSSPDDDMPLISKKHFKLVKLEQKNTSDNKPKVVKSKTTKTTKTKQKTQIKSKVKGSATTKKKSVSKKKSIEYLDASTFDISDLTLEEQISEIEKRKKTKNYTKSKFKCENCYKGFSNETSFKFHMMLHSNESGEHECPVCKIHFKTFHAMRRHLGYHVQKYTCKHCDFTTTRRSHAKNHEEFHKGTKYKCTQCPEEFMYSSTYLGHIRIKHPSDIVCELCGYSFISLKGLDLHKKLKHRFDEDTQAEADYSCEQCELTFLNAAALETHIKVSPKHVLPFEDKPTKKRIKNEKLVKRKNRKKPNPDRRKLKGRIQCEQCEVQLGSVVTYYRHFRRAHPGMNRTRYAQDRTKTFLCDQCGRMFETLAHLRDHINVHGSERAFKCEYCAKSFKTKHYLAGHLRIHTGKKKIYNCKVCGKGFASNNLKRHMLIHLGLKPFECEICGKFFKDPPERKLHITHVHLKVPWPKKNRGARTAKQDQSKDTEASSTNTDMLWSAYDDPKISL